MRTISASRRARCSAGVTAIDMPEGPTLAPEPSRAIPSPFGGMGTWLWPPYGAIVRRAADVWCQLGSTGVKGLTPMRQRNMLLGQPAHVSRLGGTARIWTLSALMAAAAAITYAAALSGDIEPVAATGHALVLAL